MHVDLRPFPQDLPANRALTWDVLVDSTGALQNATNCLLVDRQNEELLLVEGWKVSLARTLQSTNANVHDACRVVEVSMLRRFKTETSCCKPKV